MKRKGEKLFSFTCFSHLLERSKMNKIKLIIHERFNGKQSLEDVFLSVFQAESYQLLQDNSSSIMSVTEQSQDSFGSGKDKKYRTNE